MGKQFFFKKSAKFFSIIFNTNSFMIIIVIRLHGLLYNNLLKKHFSLMNINGSRLAKPNNGKTYAKNNTSVKKVVNTFHKFGKFSLNILQLYACNL